MCNLKNKLNYCKRKKNLKNINIYEWNWLWKNMNERNNMKKIKLGKKI